MPEFFSCDDGSEDASDSGDHSMFDLDEKDGDAVIQFPPESDDEDAVGPNAVHGGLKGYFFEMIHSMKVLDPLIRMRYFKEAKDVMVNLTAKMKAEKNGSMMAQEDLTHKSSAITHKEKMIQLSKRSRRK